MHSTKYLLIITLFLLCVSVIARAAGPGASSLITEGRRLLAKGQYDAAEAKFREAIKKDSDSEAWLLLGTVLNRKEAYNEALQALNRAKELKTASNAIYFEMGCAYMGLGKYKEAYESFSEDISHNPVWGSTSYLFCGICLYNLGQYRQAVTHLSNPILDGTEHSSNAHYYIGLSQLKLKEHKKAAQSFRRAKRSAPKGTKIANDTNKMLDLVEKVIKAEKRKRPWYASITTTFSLDTNVLSTADSVILPSDISNRTDTSTGLLFNAGYRLHQTPKSELWVDYRGNTTFQHDLNEYNTMMHGITLRGTRSLTPKLTAGMKVSYDYTWVGGSSYSSVFGLSPSLTYRQRDWTATTLTYTWQRSSYMFDTGNSALDRDGYTNSLSLTQDAAVPGTELYIRGGLHHSWTDSDGGDYDFDSSGLSLTMWHPFVLNTTISGGFTYFLDDYKKLNSRSAKFQKRDDDRLAISLGLSKEFTESITGFIGFTWMENKSNIGVFDYKREVFTLGVTYNF